MRLVACLCSDFDEDFSDRLDQIIRKVAKNTEGRIEASGVALLFCAVEGTASFIALFPSPDRTSVFFLESVPPFALQVGTLQMNCHR